MKVVVDMFEPMSIKEGILALMDMQKPGSMRRRQILALHKKKRITIGKAKMEDGIAIYLKWGLNLQKEDR